jgi:DNA topoisomerase VI subunit A
MSNKGLSMVAARKLIDRLAQRGVEKIFVLHDFDITGFNIFGTLRTDSRRYKFEDPPLHQRPPRARPGGVIEHQPAVPDARPGADQVDEHAAHLLRHQFDLSEVPVVVAVERDVEALILRTDTVVSEVKCFLDQAVEVNFPALAGHPVRMSQHALYDARRSYRDCRGVMTRPSGRVRSNRVSLLGSATPRAP